MFYLDSIPWILLLLPICAIFLSHILNFPQIIMLIFIVLVPLDMYASIIPGASESATLFKILFPVTFIIFIIKSVKESNLRESLRLNSMDLWLLILAVFSILSVLNSPDRTMAISEYRRLVSMWLMYFLISRLFKNANWFNAMVITLVFSSLLGLVTGLGAFITGQNYFSQDANSDFIRLTGGSNISPNDYATYLIVPLVMSFYLYLKSEKQSLKILYLLITVANLTGILFTYSRSAVLSLAFGLIFFLVNTRPKIPKKVYLFGFIASLVCIPILPTSILERMTSLSQIGTGNDYSLMRRANYWLVAKNIMKDYFWFGAGPNGFMYLHSAPEYQTISSLIGVPRQPHNEYLKSLTERGIIGTILYGAFILSAYKILLRYKKTPFGRVLFYSFGFFMIMGLFLHLQVNKIYWLHFALIRILPYLYEDREQMDPNLQENTQLTHQKTVTA